MKKGLLYNAYIFLLLPQYFSKQVLLSHLQILKIQTAKRRSIRAMIN